MTSLFKELLEELGNQPDPKKHYAYVDDDGVCRVYFETKTADRLYKWATHESAVNGNDDFERATGKELLEKYKKFNWEECDPDDGWL